MALRIENYALIGDCETAALVGRNGSIDWLCWPDFSSPACFSALVGMKQNGRWLITPLGGFKGVTRRYRDHTLILETTFVTESGILPLTDFMPVRETHSDIGKLPTSILPHCSDQRGTDAGLGRGTGKIFHRGYHDDTPPTPIRPTGTKPEKEGSYFWTWSYYLGRYTR